MGKAECQNGRGILFLLCLLACTQRPESDLKSRATSNGLSKSPNPRGEEVIQFAFRSGSSPQFIEEGPLKGLGWQERKTLEIRNAIAKQGVALETVWMSSARIEHEFKVGSPICTFPVEWNSALLRTLRTKDRIYSIPIELEGEARKTITINRDDLVKFDRFRKSNGDLDLYALLKDKGLRTLLIRNHPYGKLESLLFGEDQKGDQILKPEYADHMYLLLPHSKLQLVEMLRAHRFDYVLSELIETNDITRAGIDSSQFTEVTYETQPILSEQDPKIKFVSIACSLNPISLQAMPFINERIQLLRGRLFSEMQMEYREKIDLNKSSNPRESNPTRWLEPALIRGSYDELYLSQKDWIPNLPPLTIPGTLLRASKEKKDLGPEPRMHRQTLGQWLAIPARVQNSQALVVLSSTALALLGLPPKAVSMNATPMEDPFDHRRLREHLSEEILNVLDSYGAQKFAEKAVPFARLDLSKVQAEKVYFFAEGLQVKDFEKALPLLTQSQLRQLSVFSAGPDFSALLVDHLPSQLEKLDLTLSSLTQTPIVEKVSRMPLIELSLAATGLVPKQLLGIIQSLPPHVEVLDLASLRGSWTREVSLAFGQKKFPRLKVLDLDRAGLFQDKGKVLLPGIPRQLEKLNLSANFLDHSLLLSLFSDPFPNLRELNLSYNYTRGNRGALIPLPKGVKSLRLENKLPNQPIGQMRFPEALEELDLSRNNVDAETTKRILPYLNRIQRLGLSQTLISNSNLLEVLRSAQSIRALDLSNNRIDDSTVCQLAGLIPKVVDLDLSGNIISNQGAQCLAEKALSHLVALNLGENPIGDEGLAALSAKLPKGLRSISLAAIAAQEFSKLMNGLPQEFTSLNLDHNPLSQEEFVALANRLPASLKSLSLQATGLSTESVLPLLHRLPEGLARFVYSGAPTLAEQTDQLLRRLPKSVGELVLGNMTLFGGRSSESPQIGFPPQLVQLELQAPLLGGQGQQVLLRSLPKSLEVLWLSGLRGDPNLCDGSAILNTPNLQLFYVTGFEFHRTCWSQILGHLPTSLGVLYLGGGKIQDREFLSILQSSLPQLYFLFLQEDGLSPSAMKSFAARSYPLTLFVMLGASKEVLEEVNANLLKDVRVSLVIVATSADNAALERLLRLTPSDIRRIHFNSTRLQFRGFEAFLKSVPSQVRVLTLGHNDLGDYGYRLLKEFEMKRNARSEPPLSVEF